MQAILHALARAMRSGSTLLVVLAMLLAIAFAWGVWAGWGNVLYGLLIGLLWCLLLLCLVWWFQPPAAKTYLLTTLIGRMQARVRSGLAALKVWVFMLILIGVLGLTLRFSWLWWQQIPF